MRRLLPRRENPSSERAVRHALLAWFQRHARALPWREAASPYAVWVSEVMLQQTQVATVIPYYNRFIKSFPTVEKLAAAPLERVLELWSGLGYYRRARLLHKAAQQMVERFSGHFPADYAQARSLPGVGDYTARAVLSIAYNHPYAVVDGNVARVIARLRALRGNLHQGRFRRAVEQDLEQLLSRRTPGDFNQALMELGQTICLPRGPRCTICPLRAHCQAYRQGKPESFPEPRPRRAGERHYLATAVIRRSDKVALVRGLDDGLLGDLWNFPAAFGPSQRLARKALQQKLENLNPGVVHLGKPVGDLSHNITHRSIRVELYQPELAGSGQGDSFRWLPLSRLKQAAISRLARKIAEEFETRGAC
jgi:A/G-specific adenine glycosylase